MVARRGLMGLGLLSMSLAAGLLDVLSYRFLGQVFPSAMTGNIALMGLSLGQGDVGAALHNMTAYAGFVLGLAVGAVMLRAGGSPRALLGATTVEAALLLGFALLWHESRDAVGSGALIGLSAVAMGVQSGIAHRIGIAGVTTTYFTGTTTSIVFGLIAPGAGPRRPAARRVAWPVLAFLSYIAGAALAGWSGRMAAEVPFPLVLLPFLATVLLGIIVRLQCRNI